MATFLDVTGLQHFSSVFVFLFVVILIIAIFTYSKIMEEHQWIAWTLALIVGFFVLVSPTATTVVAKIAPWIAVLFVFVIIVAVAGKMVGGGYELGFTKPLFLIIVIIAIVVGAGVTIRSNISVPGDNETSLDFERDYSQTSTVIFHPKFMGMVLILAIAVFTIALLVTNKL